MPTLQEQVATGSPYLVSQPPAEARTVPFNHKGNRYTITSWLWETSFGPELGAWVKDAAGLVVKRYSECMTVADLIADFMEYYA